MLTDREQVREQYRDAGNLNARSAIYRFAQPGATPWARWVFEQMELAAEARILEVGCGDGGLWVRNLDRLPGGWRVAMLDLSEGMLSAARAALPAKVFAFMRGDAERLPLVDGSFDAVVANHMLYHVPERARALGEIRRVLKDGGRLYATTNSDSHLRPMQELIDRFLGEASRLRGATPFTLENGGAQMDAVFGASEVRRVRGGLRVTDAEAVVRYVMSVEGAPQRINPQRQEELRDFVRSEIARSGAFDLPTEAGMFIARR